MGMSKTVSKDGRTCPDCENGILIKRNGKYGAFMGCSNFPTCRHMEKPRYMASADDTIDKPAKDWSKFKASAYQLAIRDAFVNSNDNLIVKATAGSGKTTLLAWLAREIDPSLKAYFTAFSREIAKELNFALPTYVPASTMHSLGMRTIRKNHRGRVEVDNYRVYNYLMSIVGDDKTRRHNASIARKLVGAWKNILPKTSATDDELMALCDFQQLDITPEQINDVFFLTRTGIAHSLQSLTYVDYDDMIFIPAVKGWRNERIDVMMIDECQDLNPVQLTFLANLSIKRYLFVGDANQAIFIFRGADAEAMNRIQSGFNCKPMALPLTYRNSKAVTAFINDALPDIDHTCLDSAIEGEVDTIPEDLYLSMVTDEDLALCRYNAPLVKMVYRHWKRGEQAHVLGREMGEDLLNLIGKLNANSIDDLLAKVSEWRIETAERLNKAGKFNMVERITDQAECIINIAEEHSTIKGMITSLDKLFSDNKNGLTYCTIHKAKGLECKNAYIIAPDALLRDTDSAGDNVRFVAYSRSREGLYFVQP